MNCDERFFRLIFSATILSCLLLFFSTSISSMTEGVKEEDKPVLGTRQSRLTCRLNECQSVSISSDQCLSKYTFQITFSFKLELFCHTSLIRREIASELSQRTEEQGTADGGLC